MVKEERKITQRDIKEIGLNLIEISDYNVRTERQKENLEELKTSIERIGLIHPIILVPGKQGKYDLLAGQRRFLAFAQLKQKTIPAVIINDLDSLSKKILSFTENIHRRDLPYSDTIRICDELFNSYKGNEKQRIEKISKDIGVSPSTVAKYLAYRLVPKNVQMMVENGKISASAAYKITTAFWPNAAKIVKIAKYASDVPNTTWSRALDVGRKKPDASADEIIKESSKSPQELQFSVSFTPNTYEVLKQKADERSKLEKKEVTIKELILQIIDEYLSSGK